jgi:hypothetical protein
MTEDLENEVEAINSIYGDRTLIPTDEEDIYILRLPGKDASLRLQFPIDYPATPPAVLGTQSSGEHTKKGEAAHVVDIFRDVLGKQYQPGDVCLFNVIEEINSSLVSTTAAQIEDTESTACHQDAYDRPAGTPLANEHDIGSDGRPPWTLSDVIIELKSVFVARCAPVTSPDQAKLYLQHLLDSDKKVRSATHNITAWRIKGENGVAFQDCDDDGETAAGGRVLHLMQLMDLWDVMVVVTRWYGGHQLGPKRFSIINTVARDAFVKGDFVKEDNSNKKKGRR